MIPPEKKGAGFENLLNITAYVTFLILMGVFLYHTFEYFDHIFGDSSGGASNLGKDISIAAVEITLVAAVVVVIKAMFKGKVPEPADEDEDDKKTPGGEKPPIN